MMSGNRKGAPRRKFQMPHRIRWANEVDELTMDAHGHQAGLAGKPIFSNPTKGDVARSRWVKAYRLGAAERKATRRRSA